MPELPDITVYLEALERRIVGQVLEKVLLPDMFVLRTARPPIDALISHRVRTLRRLGKRIAIGFDHDLWLVLHLMIAGRLQWVDGLAKPAARNALAHLTFTTGTLTLTEAGTKHRASLHVVESEAGLATHDPGGVDPRAVSAEEFGARLTSASHTLKRALTDPHLFSGIGNAYSDEILHRAQLSPVALTRSLNAAQIEQLHSAIGTVMDEWIERLRAEAKTEFPTKVTAFRPEMAVHGKFGKPCPVCGTKVQRIVYAENEVNYCPRCQTGGRVLADRSLSRLLKQDWPRTIEQLEAEG